MKYLKSVCLPHPVHKPLPFALFFISLSFFDFSPPFRYYITLLMCQLSPMRLQASLLNNRSNQLPSLPPPSLPQCAPLLRAPSLRGVQGEDNFPNNSVGSKWQREEKRTGNGRDKEKRGRSADWPDQVGSQSLKSHI